MGKTATKEKPQMEEVPDFEKAAKEAGVKRVEVERLPFLEGLRTKVGNWFTGIIEGERKIHYTPKSGFNAGKKQSAILYIIAIAATNIEKVKVGDRMALSVDGGLLGFQLGEGRPKDLTYPYRVAILYKGKDDENRHQTDVRF